jgi:hypothetical protein
VNFVLPKLRDDININFFAEGEEQLVLLSDPYGYAKQSVAFPLMFYKILELIDGEKTIDELIKIIKFQFNISLNPEIIIDILKSLNDQLYLDTPNYYFNKYQVEHYNSLPNRPPVCAGTSYPSVGLDLELKISQILSSVNQKEVKPGAKFIIVPHIDFNIGKISHEVYAPAYHAIRDCDSELFVIFGTAHHISSDIFMISQKNFSTPLGTVESDKNVINDLKKELGDNLTIDESAHRYEHSIELQIVILQYLFKNRNFKILPILVGSFNEFLLRKTQPNKNNRFYNFLYALNQSIQQREIKATFIASADLAHIGRKFDDNFDAEQVLEQLKIEDGDLIRHLERTNSEAFFDSVAHVNDKRKICGLSPIYALLESQRIIYGENAFKGQFLKYNQWNEIETRSAVSFASLAYY